MKRVYRKNATRKTKNAYCIYKFSIVDRVKYWLFNCIDKAETLLKGNKGQVNLFGMVAVICLGFMIVVLCVMF